MARYYDKICEYLKDNGTTWKEANASAEGVGIRLRDDVPDGVSTPYIEIWNVVGIAKPSESKLDEYTAAAEAWHANEVVVTDRRIAYGKIEDELDMIYKDILAGKLDATGSFAIHVKKVKDDNPKG